MTIHVAELPPMYCSSCFCSDPTKTYIDFDSDCDRGYGDDPNKKITFDLLILCEDCVRSAGRLVDMVDAKDSDFELTKLRVENDRLRRESTQAQNYADRLEDAFDKRPQPINVNHRKKPRPIHPDREMKETA